MRLDRLQSPQSSDGIHAIMQTYKTVGKTDKLNEFIKVGWKFIHAYSKQIGDAECQDFAPHFVIVWDFPSEPQIPRRYQKAEPIERVEPVPAEL